MNKLIIVVRLGAVAPANAAINLVTNGKFLESTGVVRQQIGAGIIGTDWSGTEFRGWTTGGYNFGFQWQFVDRYGSPGQYGWLKLWGENNGGVNRITRNPDGGNIIGADGAFEVTPITQQITGLAAATASVAVSTTHATRLA